MIDGGKNGSFFLGLLHGAAFAVFLGGLVIGAATALLVILGILLAASLIALAIALALSDNDQAVPCALLGLWIGFELMLAPLLVIASGWKKKLFFGVIAFAIGLLGYEIELPRLSECLRN